jgi:hypothetical protein
MIKPFKILEEHLNEDGITSVVYEAICLEKREDNITTTKKIRGYLEIPSDKTVDQHVFDELSASGWV